MILINIIKMSEQRIQCIIVGESGVGKTSLFYQCAGIQIPVKPSIGVEFIFLRKKTGGESFKIELWDIPGRVDFRGNEHVLCKTANVIIYVFDLSNRASFDAIDNWAKNIRNMRAHKILLGNKLDMERCVSIEEATEKAIAIGATQYSEVSAKDSSVLKMLDDYLSYSRLCELPYVKEDESVRPELVIEDKPLTNTNIIQSSEDSPCKMGNFDDSDVITRNPVWSLKPTKIIDPSPSIPVSQVFKLNLYGFTITINYEGDIWSLLGCPRRPIKVS